MPFPDGAYLVDTSILARLDQPNSPARPVVVTALAKLAATNHPLYIAPQNLIEFWNVATRPANRNGLNLTPAQTLARILALKGQFGLLIDAPSIYQIWEYLADAAQVSGKQVHDTRLVAVMVANGLPNPLTLNAADFRRFESIANITVVEPTDG